MARKFSQRRMHTKGLPLVGEIRPDVALSDINTPRRNGVELLADIRSLGRNNGGNVLVVAMTGYVFDQVVHELLPFWLGAKPGAKDIQNASESVRNADIKGLVMFPPGGDAWHS